MVMTAISYGTHTDRLYGQAAPDFINTLWGEIYSCSPNPRTAETWLHALTNPVESYEDDGKLHVTWARPRFARWTAPRYLRSPEAAIKLVMKVAECAPDPLDTNEVARKALTRVTKGSTIFWGHRASEHIAHAIVVEMLTQLDAMKGNH